MRHGHYQYGYLGRTLIPLAFATQKISSNTPQTGWEKGGMGRWGYSPCREAKTAPTFEMLNDWYQVDVT